jgi:NAD(P)-dependent dehydrogenase (short-subunit alcohol dehydrogenase family)
MDLAGRVALVTGAASGIGRVTAIRLAAEGMRLCCVDRDADGAQRIAAEVGGTAFAADVSLAAETDAAFAHCVAELGALDLAYLNAGIAIARSDIASLEDDEYRRILGVNVDAVVFGARAAIRTMRAQGRGGVLIATASLAGIVPFALDPVYALTKHAVVGFMRSLAPGVEDDGIAVHAICPGLTDTPLLGERTKEMLTAANFPVLAPEQIAGAVVDAASASTTGTCWVCQPGRAPLPYEFRDVPGPRTEGAEGRRPPELRRGQRFTA